MANIKNLTSEELSEVKKIVLSSGYLTKKEVLNFCENFKISLFTFRKKLKENLIPFDSARVDSILTPYGINIESNSILLSEFLGLGNWRREVFKNSNTTAKFNCINCGISTSSRISGLLNRKYFKEEPYCSKCITIAISQHSEYKNNMSISQKICKNTLESKKKNSIIMKKRWENKEERGRLIKLMNDATKVDGYKEKMSAARKKNWEDDGYRSNMVKERKERWKSNDYREKVKKSFTLRTPEQNDISFNSKTSFKRKEYVMPSGRVVKIQGYENKALDFLLKKYSEEDLVVGTKSIRLEIGEIFYINNGGKSYRYFPDIYIKSENKIIEVKSAWTYKKYLDVNKLKQKACISQNFSFNFIIFGRKNSKILKEVLEENQLSDSQKYDCKFNYFIL